MKLLVTGANGQLGSELRDLLCHSRENGNPVKDTLAAKSLDPRLRGDDNVLFVDREELDITDGSAVDAYIANHKPDYCINAAAYTNVEKAEDERDSAHAVNAIGAKNIARACAKNNTILFHISTDFVFDGKKTSPYTEEDEPHPLGVYGQTKYEGELVVQEYCPKSFTVRTSWLYSSYGSNFVRTIMRLCKERDSLPVVADQYGSPTYARDLAEVLLKMIDVCEGKRATTEDFFGVYHYANDGEVTWFEFAQKIRDIVGHSCDLQPIPASDFPSKVTRPTYSVLSTKKIQTTFGVAIPEWGESLRECIDMLRRDP